MSISSLQDLFVHTLQDVYFAENFLTKKIPVMSKAANSKLLKNLFDAHLEETRTHVKRLEEVFASLGIKAEGEECPAIEGIVSEAEELLDEVDDAKTTDAALIASAQAVEHYEITRYGTLVSWATELGHTEAATILRQTLAEEKEADNKLLRLGEDRLNEKAA
ncbi:ferritin-like domain-containing protein [Roseibium limicola]|uniref:Ferritin-like domain-containing protein n=1 Tax=Roseibium limicola TaxID=2816037 RepID=A0A939ER92_9HYPH|nr:ferritin-like domain-containing protein [Roseibium limicola]MBO0347112.1 ferritin-like domain-containing protein [Roseibium limicola]